MSARNGDKSRFHRLRKAKIRRRLRTELLQSLVTTAPEHPATEAPAKPPKPPKAKAAEAVAPKAEAPKAAKPKAEKSKAPESGAPETGAAKTKAPKAEKPKAETEASKEAAPEAPQPHDEDKPAAAPSEEHHGRGPLAAVAETLGSTIGTIVAKTTHPHPDDKPAE